MSKNLTMNMSRGPPKNKNVNKRPNKILISQYGKVGGTSLTINLLNKFNLQNKTHLKHINIDFIEPLDNPNQYPPIIKTHSHLVTEDVLSKFTNVLVIITVRLPIDRALSDYFQNRQLTDSDWESMTVNDIIKKNISSDSINYTDNWMFNFFKTINVDYSKIKFDFEKKYILFKKDTHTFFFYRCEDTQYINSNILPKFGITNIMMDKKYNVTEFKSDGNIYKEVKEKYRISKDQIDTINNSFWTNLFYSKEEIDKHIQKYSNEIIS